jgi:hypothetical protein
MAGIRRQQFKGYPRRELWGLKAPLLFIEKMSTS